MLPKARAAIFDMQHAAIGIGLFVTGKTLDDYNDDLMLRSAVERQFEIIGEAMTRLRKIEPDLLNRFSEYMGIISFRNVLIHGYDTVNNEISWKIIKEKLPTLVKELEEALKEPTAPPPAPNPPPPQP